MSSSFHGTDLEEEKRLRHINMQRDIRTSSERFADWVRTKGAFSIPLISLLIVIVFQGALLYIVILNYFFIYLMHKHLYAPLDFKKPKSSFEPDPKNRDPRDLAEGIFFLGNNAVTGNQLYLDDSDIRTHVLIFGTTGAGKTESLVSLCVNFMIYGSGFIYVDGKADTGLYLSIFSLLRRFGRDMDILLINYMIGLEDLNIKRKQRLSNKMNPFSMGSSDNLTELIVSLLPDDGDGIWKGRASSFMSALMRVLVLLRDRGEILLDVDVIRKYFELEKVEELIARQDISDQYKDGLISFVSSLAGYKKPTAQEPVVVQEFDTLQQFGFITMQYTETFGLLADTFGHIMNTQLAECDFFDVVVNRRVLVVLLPALEKSQQNLSNLGKIIFSSIKMMMASTLGSSVVGKKVDIIDSKPTFSDSPYLTIFDEFGYYAVKGAEVMPAQARGLGFSLIFAGQDYQAFKKSSPESAASIVANCALKLCMKLEDPTETFEIFEKAAGQARVVESTSMKKDFDSMSSDKYTDEGNIGFQYRSRINVRDLKGQESGEAHIIFGDSLVRGKMFYAAPTKVNEMMINEFLEVGGMSLSELTAYRTGLRGFTVQFKRNVADDKEYKDYLKQVIGSIGVAGEMINIREAFSLGNKFDLDYKAFFALASYIERVEFIDNKIITELIDVDPDLSKNIVATKNVEKPLSTEVIERKKAIDKIKDKAESLNRPTTDSRVPEIKSARGDRTVESFKKAVLMKKKAIMDSGTDPFKLINGSSRGDLIFDNDRVSKKIEEMSRDSGNSNSELLAESVVTDVGVSLIYPDDERIKSKGGNKFILEIIDDIEIKDI